MNDTVIFVPISPGELIDKITILEIKEERIHDEAKLMNIRKELAMLRVELDKLPHSAELDTLHKELFDANALIWDAEEVLRPHWDEDALFLEYSRKAHAGNDERFRIKRKINEHLGSAINEEKSHQK